MRGKVSGGRVILELDARELEATRTAIDLAIEVNSEMASRHEIKALDLGLEGSKRGKVARERKAGELRSLAAGCRAAIRELRDLRRELDRLQLLMDRADFVDLGRSSDDGSRRP